MPVDAVRLLSVELIGLIFEGGVFEEMISGAGFGMAAKALKPVLFKKALASARTLNPEQAEWLIDQVHKLSAEFEERTGQLSPYHLDSE